MKKDRLWYGWQWFLLKGLLLRAAGAGAVLVGISFCCGLGFGLGLRLLKLLGLLP